jgi:hypothetical protein
MAARLVPKGAWGWGTTRPAVGGATLERGYGGARTLRLIAHRSYVKVRILGEDREKRKKKLQNILRSPFYGTTKFAVFIRVLSIGLFGIW